MSKPLYLGIDPGPESGGIAVVNADEVLIGCRLIEHRRKRKTDPVVSIINDYIAEALALLNGHAATAAAIEGTSYMGRRSQSAPAADTGKLAAAIYGACYYVPLMFAPGERVLELVDPTHWRREMTGSPAANDSFIIGVAISRITGLEPELKHHARKSWTHLCDAALIAAHAACSHRWQRQITAAKELSNERK